MYLDNALCWPLSQVVLGIGGIAVYVIEEEMLYLLPDRNKGIQHSNSP